MADDEAETIAVAVIGHARTPWRRREDAPHQPVASPAAEGVLEIAPAYRAGARRPGRLRRASGSCSTSIAAAAGRPTVKPPRGGPKRGVFATRAPNRPSQIGLTCAELTGVDVAAGLRPGARHRPARRHADPRPQAVHAALDAWPDAGHGWLQPYLDAGVEPRLKKPYRPPRDGG